MFLFQVEYREFVRPDGSGYKGNCLVGRNVPHGFGIEKGITWKYEGLWDNGLRSGNGTLIFHSPVYYSTGFMYRYDGSFKYGQMHGNGTALYCASQEGNSAIRYAGGWDTGNWSGYGTVTYADGSQCAGGFRMGQPEGYHVIIAANGTSYVGGIKDRKAHGHGRSTCADGRWYEGGWKDGKQTGDNICTSDANLLSSSSGGELPLPPLTRSYYIW